MNQHRGERFRDQRGQGGLAGAAGTIQRDQEGPRAAGQPPANFGDEAGGGLLEFWRGGGHGSQESGVRADAEFISPSFQGKARTGADKGKIGA